MKQKQPIFGKSLAAICIVILFLIVYLFNAGKPKTAFSRVDGAVTGIANNNNNYPGKDTARFRYISISNYPKPFELFIGKGAGDFKAELDHTEYLKDGDSISVYYDESAKTAIAPVNNRVYYIDKGGQTIFREGNSKRILIYGLIAFCLLFSLVLVLLRRMGKIS